MTQLDHTSLDALPTPLTGQAVEPRARAAALHDLMALAKPGIVRMVLVTTVVGFSIAAMARQWTLGHLVAALASCLVGTALSAGGANALNQAMEWRRDAAMRRTRTRPVPAGRLSCAQAWAWGLGWCAAGVAVLAIGANAVAALVSLVTILTYVLMYTPMKPRTSLATLAGTIPGALPPLIGWSAAWSGSPAGEVAWRGLDHPGGWSLVLLMIVWQVPHFLAIAWMYREDYARGGMKMLPLIDGDGRCTAQIALLWTVALVPVSLWPILAMPERLGLLYGPVALAGGLGLLVVATRLFRGPSVLGARRLFLGSIIYLPVVLLALVGDVAATRWVW